MHSRGRGRLVRGLGLLALLALAIGAAFVMLVWRPAQATARLEAARAARVACSCRYVGGRTLGDCEKDMPPGRFPVSLSQDPAAHTVTASVPLAAAQTATYRKGWGCLLQPWQD
ncbi:hypothetical protein [Novosphingobium pituita]|uniref:hypothetical protein n=1 Tax=Novosphingobium pituita TaxID=3056842 RepID=UPI00295EC410|nr:hypothetical protein [Novosphingobium sp. IK01]